MLSYEDKDVYTIDDLERIIELLRLPEGCPWDREQTHQSIRNNFLEEAYEACEAIDEDSTEMLREELGDVLLQVVFHCVLGKEEDRFSLSDVTDEVCRKLLIRHPHVFGETSAENVGEALANWEEVKKTLKGQTTYTETLESVPKTLPALAKAQKIGKRAAKAGMDFESAESAFDCVRAERAELQAAIAMGDASQIEDELGDLLFSCVNTARHFHIDAEETLEKATKKFVQRFARAEQFALADSQDMALLTAEERDEYWQRAKEELA